MACKRPARRENDCPWGIAQPAPQFAIDEIGNAPEKQADRRGCCNDIEHAPDGNLVASSKQDHGDRRARKAAMERHPAIPDF
ncbi:hypothetical protein D3C80_1682240 [compost metagenome]